MIGIKINNLFEFIDFLHSNIDNFNSYNATIKKAESLGVKRSSIDPHSNFKARMEYDEVQAELDKNLEIIQKNTANPITSKAKELNVCDFKNTPLYSWNGIETNINELKVNFSKKDLPKIFEHKQKYIEYRKNTHKTFLSLSIFFFELDRIVKDLFDYFKESEHNEFEDFEEKPIHVKNIEEAIIGFKDGNSSFVLTEKEFFNLSEIKIQPIAENNLPELPENKKLILFDNEKTINKVHTALKGFFTDRESEFLRALQGEKLDAKLHFPTNQNKLVEVFRRLKYNSYLVSSPKEIKEWLNINFTYLNKRKREQRELNASTIHDILTKGKGEPTKRERINIDWLPYKTHESLNSSNNFDK